MMRRFAAVVAAAMLATAGLAACGNDKDCKPRALAETNIGHVDLVAARSGGGGTSSGGGGSRGGSSGGGYRGGSSGGKTVTKTPTAKTPSGGKTSTRSGSSGSYRTSPPKSVNTRDTASTRTQRAAAVRQLPGGRLPSRLGSSYRVGATNYRYAPPSSFRWGMPYNPLNPFDWRNWYLPWSPWYHTNLLYAAAHRGC